MAPYSLSKSLEAQRSQIDKKNNNNNKKKTIIYTLKVQSSVYTHFTANNFSLAATVKILVLS